MKNITKLSRLLMVAIAFFLMYEGNASANSHYHKEIPIVQKDGDYYVDNQGLRYNIDTDNATASVAGDISSPGYEKLGANFNVDFSSVDGVITIPVNITFEGKEYPVKSIEECAFYNYNSMNGNLTIKELHFAEGSVLTTIGENAFYSASNLNSIDFTSCTSLTAIGESAFWYCEKVESLDFTSCTSLSTIGEDAFYNCSKLKSIDFTSCASLTTIGEEAFSYCSNTISITLPESGWSPEGVITSENWSETFSRTIK